MMKVLPRAIRRLTERRGSEPPAGRFSYIELDDEAIRRGDYKSTMGGGAEFWEVRGRFQLELMRRVGLTSTSRLIDIGCGIIRGGVHFIRFLPAGNYTGIDGNPSFVRATRLIIEQDPDLRRKSPVIEVVKNFQLAKFATNPFDFALAFSVLNHASADQRDRFISGIAAVLAPGGKVVVTHAAWMAPRQLKKTGLLLRQRLGQGDLDLRDQGRNKSGEMFPILVLERPRP
jgi:SAM-dependent methyltransferase